MQERGRNAPTAEQRDELALEPIRVVADVLARRLADDQHLAQVSLGCNMTLEAIVLRPGSRRRYQRGRGESREGGKAGRRWTHIAALLLANLTVPAELAEAL